MAPMYATLTLGFLEENLYDNIAKDFCPNLAENIKNTWKRYLDDCFIIWNQEILDLETFHELLNNIDPDIKFTIEESQHDISFLDICITHEGESLSTDIYYKPTDTHQYLHFNSCHPRHTKRAIPYNLARRICTIVSDEKKRNQRLEEMKKYLRNQGYPIKLIEDGIMKAKNLDRKQLINPPSPDVTTQEILPFVTTYNPKNKNITPFVKHLNDVLKTDERMSKVLGNFRVIESKRQPKNLKRILCKSNLRNNNLHTVRKCPDQRCGTCPYLKEGNIFKIGEREFKVNSSMTCGTKNLIYCIICGGCEQYCIGETGTTLRTRIRVHKQQIQHPEYRKIKVSEHLDICGKGHFTVIPLYKFYSDNVLERREKEKHFIRTLKPSLNSDIAKN